MAKQNKIHMPSSGGGLVRYFDDYKSKIMISPKAVIIVLIIIAILEILLYKGVF